MPHIDPLTLAGNDFVRLAESVNTAEYEVPSTCDDWTVADLIGHVVNGCRMTGVLMGGGSALDATAAGAEPIEGPLLDALRAASALQAAALASPQLDQIVVHHPVIDMTGRQLLGLRIVEFTVHAWDLAQSLGLDHTVDTRLADLSWMVMEPLADFTADLGVFGPGSTGKLPSGATAMERVLDATGRRVATDG